MTSSNTCTDQYSAEESLLFFSLLFLLVSLPSPLLCPVNSTCLGFPMLPSPSLQLRESISLCMGYPSLQHGLETSSRQLARATIGLTLFALHLTGVTVPHIQCLENHCFIYYAQFVSCFRRESNLLLHIGQMWNS